ncbi:hypothetical protein AVEN_163113-1 [Araneus ventricosus]|uniref:Uncharacterized protein n=1 Tax=Araneus ventricosus TaxID=182803 RepID=A0A4Y2DJ89_ARAVE|nr:hypothetical protein AVEN_163113-1 [Araneus ventricosus]
MARTTAQILSPHSHHRPMANPIEGGTFRYRRGVAHPTLLLCPPEKQNPLTYPATSHPITRGVSLGGITYLYPVCQQGTIQSGGASVMVWEVYSWRDMGPLIRLETTLTGT